MVNGLRGLGKTGWSELVESVVDVWDKARISCGRMRRLPQYLVGLVQSLVGYSPRRRGVW